MMAREFKDSGIEWIGRIPKEWKTVPFKAYFSTGKGLSFTKADLTPSGKAVVSYGQIHSKQNTGTRLDDFLIRFIPDSLTENGESSRMNKGDFIFADTSEDLEGCGNSVYVDRETELYAGYHSVTAKSKVQQANKYFAYYFLTPCWRSQIRSRVTGIKVFSISQSIINQTSIIVPPLSEQQRIADYLDKKCGEIDELIALQEQMIAQLTDYKQSVITEAVTKGLNPDAELVPSGIDWIGDVPKGWKVCRIKDLFRLRTGTTPKEFEQGLDSDELVTWFTPSDVTEINCELNSSERHLSKEVIEKEGIELSPSGSLIFVGIGASAGKIGFATVDSYSNQQITTLIPKKNKCFGKYSYYYMIADRKRIRENAFFTTLPIINNSYLSGIKTLVPPLSEQQAIATYLDTKCSEIDSLVALKQQKIETLKDYKKSVIYEAVTGKMTIGETP